MLTSNEFTKKIAIATNKMMMPFDHYLNKQTKRYDLKDNEILSLALSTLVNVFVKSIMLVRVILAGRQSAIDVDKVIDHIATETKNHFQRLEGTKKFKKMTH